MFVIHFTNICLSISGNWQRSRSSINTAHHLQNIYAFACTLRKNILSDSLSFQENNERAFVHSRRCSSTIPRSKPTRVQSAPQDTNICQQKLSIIFALANIASKFAFMRAKQCAFALHIEEFLGKQCRKQWEIGNFEWEIGKICSVTGFGNQDGP